MRLIVFLFLFFFLFFFLSEQRRSKKYYACVQGARTIAGQTQHENNLSQRKIKSNLNGSNIFGIMETNLDMGSSSHRGLIIAQDQKANGTKTQKLRHVQTCLK